MHVGVDRVLCQGHGQCQEVAPELFELRDDDGLAHAIAQPDTTTLEDKAKDALRRCPVEAVLIDG
jgi:ferredoxin